MASKQQINTTLSSGGFVQNKGLYNSQGQPVANANGNPSADLTPAQLRALEGDDGVTKTVGYDNTRTYRQS